MKYLLPLMLLIGCVHGHPHTCVSEKQMVAQQKACSTCMKSCPFDPREWYGHHDTIEYFTAVELFNNCVEEQCKNCDIRNVEHIQICDDGPVEHAIFPKN